MRTAVILLLAAALVLGWVVCSGGESEPVEPGPVIELREKPAAEPSPRAAPAPPEEKPPVEANKTDPPETKRLRVKDKIIQDIFRKYGVTGIP